MAIYLLHFSEPYRHAQHYLGFVDTSRHSFEEALESRMEFHRKGRGSRLLKAVTAAGIDWVVVRTWKDGTRTEERQLKGRSSTRLCPICNPLGYERRGILSNRRLLEPQASQEGWNLDGSIAERPANHGHALLAQGRAGGTDRDT